MNGARKGRGAVSNAGGRFEKLASEVFDDGWSQAVEDDPPRLETQVTRDGSRSVIARNDSPDVPFTQSINPYRGCEHGCIYCFARPTHAWLGLSPGLDFETRLFAKPDAPDILRRELARPGYVCRVIAMGTNTDPYQPVERRHRITRGILEVLSECEHPVSIVTKSKLVMRDIDILSDMARRGLASVVLSVTTLDKDLARRMEPRASTPRNRLAAIEALSAAGIPTGVLVAPVIPALNDHELEKVVEASAAAGARSAGYVLLRLPLEIKDLFGEWLDEHFPERKDRVLNRMRAMREGALYQSEFSVRQRGTGPEATVLERRFALIRRRLGLEDERSTLDTSRFRRPTVSADDLPLFAQAPARGENR